MSGVSDIVCVVWWIGNRGSSADCPVLYYCAGSPSVIECRPISSQGLFCPATAMLRPGEAVADLLGLGLSTLLLLHAIEQQPEQPEELACSFDAALESLGVVRNHVQQARLVPDATPEWPLFHSRLSGYSNSRSRSSSSGSFVFSD